MPSEKYMLIDTHTHILPDMDDGAPNAEVGVKMVKALLNQGVQSIIATPHYYHHLETVSEFLNRREKAYLEIMSEMRRQGIAERPIVLGAEVSIERDLQYAQGVEKLCIEGTDIILFELPYSRLKGWEVSVIENIIFKHRLRPMIAHVDRYLDVFEESDFMQLYQIPDVIFQVDASCVDKFRYRSFLMKLIKKGRRVVLGSDCHNMGTRKPDYIKGIQYLGKKLDKESFNKLLYNMQEILNIT
jgi:protein-tyrosine phosphatase